MPMEPFQLEFAIPEIGAEPGDWIDIDLHSRPPGLVLMRRIPREHIRLIRHQVGHLSRFLGRLPPDPGDGRPSASVLRRLK